MALSVDWPTRVIFVPKVDLTPLGGEVYQFDTDAFRLTLKSLEDSPEGMVYPDTHQHNTSLTLGGVTYARAIELINDFTVTFEDGQYAVTFVGSNNNIADVTNVNQVSVRPNNSAGLVQVASAGGAPTASEMADAVHAKVVEGALDLASVLRVLLAYAAGAGTGLTAAGGAVAFKSLDGNTTRIAGTIAPSTGVRTLDNVDGS